MSIAVELVGFLMCVGGWLLTAVSLANDYWRLSSVSGSVIISVRQYQNLWQSCAEGSTGVSNCRTFQSLLALDGNTHHTHKNKSKEKPEICFG